MMRSKLLDGFKAVRTLLNNPEDSKQVFRVFAALRGKSHLKAVKRLEDDQFGNRILAGELDLAAKLTDRSLMQSFNNGSIAHSYLAFTSREQISAYGLKEASAETMDLLDEGRVKNFFNRMRDSHDLWHVTTQYGREPLGEACLLAFTYAQTRNRAILFILTFGYFKLASAYGRGVLKALIEGYLRGKRANWLPLIAWEERLGESVDQFREAVKVHHPKHYLSFVAKHRMTAAGAMT